MYSNMSQLEINFQEIGNNFKQFYLMAFAAILKRRHLYNFLFQLFC